MSEHLIGFYQRKSVRIFWCCVIAGAILIACSEQIPATATPTTALTQQSTEPLETSPTQKQNHVVAQHKIKRPPSNLDHTMQGWLFGKGQRSVRTGWEDDPAKLRADACKSCHVQSHADWSQDIHARAWTDPLFIEAFRKETKLWCVHCHAPLRSQLDAYQRLSNANTLPKPEESGRPNTPDDPPAPVYGSADATSPPDTPDAQDVNITNAQDTTHYSAEARAADQALLDEGINCAGCHVRNGEILGARESVNDAHAVTVTPYLTSPEFCGECHQFNFPKHPSTGRVEYSREPMQNTLIEWRNADPGITCIQCHTDPQNPHRTYGPHDAEWMRARFPAPTISWEDPKKLRIQFRVPARGHKVPSGDLFHSIALETATTDAYQKPQTEHAWRRRYRVTADVTPAGSRRALSRDTTISAEAQDMNVIVDTESDTGPLFNGPCSDALFGWGRDAWICAFGCIAGA